MPFRSHITDLYRKFVRLYPNPFRTEYGDELVMVFEETWRRNAARQTIDRIRFLAFVVWDGLKSLAKEWGAALPWPTKVVAAGAIAIAAIDVGLRTYSGLANVMYLWASIAIAVISIRAVRHRQGIIVVSVALVTTAVLYFGAGVLREFASPANWHPRFRFWSDLLELAIALFALLATVEPISRSQRWRPGFFGERRMIRCLQILCVAGAVLGMLRNIVFNGTDDTAFVTLIANALFDGIRRTWSRGPEVRRALLR